ncbi:hypothetical protein L596_018632 [Steinernema carpocapsae]|uniref:Uncharacterized protein n=1 Tax=Steinernema carpocapsae TaxID=34508 RepID=A0A4U5N698_STECR|nr:hypothetical protein L596_018632 [Steinernema carpocapsae]
MNNPEQLSKSVLFSHHSFVFWRKVHFGRTKRSTTAIRRRIWKIELMNWWKGETSARFCVWLCHSNLALEIPGFT